MKKLIALNLLVALLLLAVPLAGMELWLRLTIAPSSNESIYVYTLDTKRYKLMKANAAVTAWGKELRTNNLGFRDSAAALPPKQPGEFRIVVLGDSFTVSAGVDFDNIYTTLVEKRLRQSFPNVKVINLAVGGYNIIQYALVLQEVALGLDPDMVLVCVFPDNDFSLENYETNYRVAAGQASPEPVRAWYEALYVYRAYGSRIAARVARLFQNEPAGQTGAAGWEQNGAALKAIAAHAAQRNLPLHVALLPHTWNLEKQRELFGRVERLCRQHEIDCLNLLEPFIAAGIAESSLRLNVLDAHPNERYNALVAEQLAADLERFLSAKRELVRTGG